MGLASYRVEPEPVCVRVSTAMRLLGIGKTKLYELIATGDLETIRIGRWTLIMQASIDSLVARLREAARRPRVG
jgi:excisionase family DNA binding protein